MRIFRGIEYWNCDDYTEEEMEMISDWENADPENRREFVKKRGWDKCRKGLFAMGDLGEQSGAVGQDVDVERSGLNTVPQSKGVIHIGGLS